MESGVDFVAADNPHANKLMLHMLAAFAEHEREQISERTKAASDIGGPRDGIVVLSNEKSGRLPNGSRSRRWESLSG
jgi:hypothetical protein